MKKFLNNKGFTLIELVTITTITILLTSMFLANYRGGQKSLALTRSTHKLSQDIRTAKEMAMVGKYFYGSFPARGYGIYLVQNSNSYILFADCNSNGIYDAGLLDCPDCSGGSCINNVISEKVQDLALEVGIRISNISPPSPLNITFFPPDPTVTITPAANSAVITLTLDGRTKRVTINSVGLIEIN